MRMSAGRTRLLAIVLILLVGLGLASCAPLERMATPTPPPTPASPVDGVWQGSGAAQTGLPFQIYFEVQDHKLSRLRYVFPGTDSVPCHGIDYAAIPEAQRPPIAADNSLDTILGPDLSASIRLDPQSATGLLTIHWHDRQPRCNGEYLVKFSAAKQAVEAAHTTTAHNPNSARPIEVLIQILVFGLSNGAILALNAIGVSLIYSAVRTLNLAHGDVFALSTALVTSLINALAIATNWPPAQLILALAFVFLCALVLGAILSLGVERFGFAPFRGASRLAPLIATLGISFILFQAALVWRTHQPSWRPGEHRSVPGLPEVPTDGIPSFLPEVDLVHALGLPYHVVIRFSDVFVVALAALLVVVVHALMQRSRTGRAIRAVSQNEMMARIMGIDVDQTIRRAFALGGALAGAAAFVFALYYSRPFGFHGAQSGLIAFMAALLGGIGSPVGAFFSSLLIGSVSALSDYYLLAQWTPAILLALMIALFVWRPTGFSGSDSGPESGSVRDSVILTAPSSRSDRRGVILAVLVALVLLPFVLHSGLTIIRLAGVFVLLALGLNLALGVSGVLDLGFAASFGVAAYFTALVTSKGNIVTALILGALVGAAVGWIKGGIARRVHSDFFGVATLALALLIRQTIINLNFTGGMGGIGSIPPPHLWTWKLVGQSERYFLVLVMAALLAWISVRLIRSRTGRAWIALSDDESAALAAGVDVQRMRTLVLVVSSAFAGVAGVLYATTLSFIDPDIMAFHVSSMILTMVILGGAGNVGGVILGTIIIVMYDKVLVPKLADWVALLWPVAIGSAPDIRGASFFNFGIALYLTVMVRARRKRT